jgi:hypothetical protein
MKKSVMASPMPARRVSKPVIQGKKAHRSSRASKLFAIWTDVVSRCIDEPHSDKDPLNKELCSRCARIDFDTLFDGPRLPDTPSLESTAVGSIHDIIENHRCPFCRLLAHTVKVFRGSCLGQPCGCVMLRHALAGR